MNAIDAPSPAVMRGNAVGGGRPHVPAEPGQSFQPWLDRRRRRDRREARLAQASGERMLNAAWRHPPVP